MPAKRLEIYVGEEYGRYTVLEESRSNSGKFAWLCRCECGNLINVLPSDLKSGHCKGCQECKSSYRSVGDVKGFYLTNLVSNALARGILVDLTVEDLYDIWVNQNGRCALSGLPLKLMERKNSTSWTASLDRIDSSMHYVSGNVQWVHKMVNIMKNSYSEDDFIKMCKLVADYR